MYHVVVTGPARRDFLEQHDWWATNRSAEQAARWYAGFYDALLSLAHNPERRSLAPEDGVWPYQLRQLTFGLGRRPSHRALFCIRGDAVFVLRVRSLAQSELQEGGLDFE